MQEVAMSRYHSVRPKPKHHSVPTPAAPAQPPAGKGLTPVQRQELQKRMESAADQMYRDRGGTEIDATIERCKKLLDLHARELLTLDDHDFSKAHRWTVSPTVAFRYETLMHQLIVRREQMQMECAAMVQQAVAEVTGEAKESSLCPPKLTEPASSTAPAAGDQKPQATPERPNAPPGGVTTVA